MAVLKQVEVEAEVVLRVRVVELIIMLFQVVQRQRYLMQLLQVLFQYSIDLL